MSVKTETQIRKDTVYSVAARMVAAARTAPKARGVDNIEAAIVDGADIKKLYNKMIEMVEQNEASRFFLRDAENTLSSEAVVLIGTSVKPMGLKHCGLCGFTNCDEKIEIRPSAPCVFNTGDLGIAVGSAVSIAMDERIDNRIMFSVGKAAKELKMLGEGIEIIYGIPLSCSSKNPFFDREFK